MAQVNNAQLRRLVLIRYTKNAEGNLVENPFEIEPDQLGQDTTITVNIQPRKMTRSSQMGTTERPIPGTFDAFAGSITFLMDTFQVLGEVIGNWQKATYPGATAAEGQITDAGQNFCLGGEYVRVIAQGVCDDGSAVDVDLTRCIPSMDGDIELGGSDTPEVTIALNPQIYNSATYGEDGYPAYSYRMGVESLTEKTRLDATTGKYVPVTVTTVETDAQENA